MIRRFALPLLVTACLAALVSICFGSALFRGEQFGYRDAAHFYYPLYQRVQQEWDAGRWPLWEPEENGGMPLLGNPTAAVFYPGKLIYALVPYAWGARLYVVAHTILAFAAMLALMRSFRVSWVGATLSGLAYAFSGPILFQYCNIIYLVGAAWVPLGFRAVDRWLRLGRRVALVELAVVLAMETLGGDPECAYLTGLCAGGYAIALVLGRARANPPVRGSFPSDPSRAWLKVTAALVLFFAWVAGTIAMAAWAPRVRPHKFPPVALPWMPWVPLAVTGLWAIIALIVFNRWRRQRLAARNDRPVFVPMLAGLVLSAVLAGAVSAAQLLPVLEFTGQSVRAAGEGPHDIHPFSLQPWRAVEFLWPNPFGTPFNGNRSWLAVLPPSNRAVKIWVPTLYFGGLTLVLALGALRVGGNDGAPWRPWLSGVALISLIGACGEFTGPLFYARYVPSLVSSIGPHDPPEVAAIRFDHHLRDGDGSFYWFMATLLPGFRQFRFPSKLLTFTVMALAALAGQGWDDLLRGDARQKRVMAAWTVTFLALTVLTFTAVAIKRADLAAYLSVKKLDSAFGPLETEAAVGEMLVGLIQGAVVLVISLALSRAAARRPLLAAVVALSALTSDLAYANARYVLTVPQALLDETPEVLSIIRQAEASNPATGPYRIHRSPIWNPYVWSTKKTTDRVRDFVEWERGTLQPKYGIEKGVQFTLTFGVAELYDYEWFLGGFNYTVTDQVARSLKVEPRSKVVAFARRSYDFWTSRYFVLPYYAKWKDEHRGFASFLDQTDRIYPAKDAFTGPGGADKEYAWTRDHDFQVLRNLAVYPRAWVVHGARWHQPITGLNRKDRERLMEEIMFSNDPIWNDPNRTVYDPKQLAWLEVNDRPALGDVLRNAPADASEQANVVRFESDRVEIEATLKTPGMVVLADVYYPGWTLTIDGKPAPVYRANRMMRGAAVSAGRHRLVYTFRPNSFRVGLAVSGCGLTALVLLSAWFVRRPFDPTHTSTEGARDQRGKLQ